MRDAGVRLLRQALRHHPAITPVEMPIGLNHLDSDVCWCDPLVEGDENGQDVVGNHVELEIESSEGMRS